MRRACGTGSAAVYRIEIVFLKLDSVQLAVKRIRERVKQVGHHVPATDVGRRLYRGWANFQSTYRAGGCMGGV
jgi:predicted ABC-type ATPase